MSDFVRDVVIGVAGWAAAAVLVKNLPSSFYEDHWSFVFLTLGPLVGAGFPLLLRQSGVWKKETAFKSVAVTTATALVLDGVAHAFAHDFFYGSTGAKGSSLIFFGAGLGMLVLHT